MRTIYLTVDTECHDLNNSNLYIEGFDGKEYWGLKRILELGKESDIPINFFVDVGEAVEYGDKYIQNIVDLIHNYKQPVFFHLHPDYISKDHSRTFLWEYTKQEKEKIFHKALEIYEHFAGKQDRLVFRAGRYGVDSEFYDILKDSGIKILDLSYLCGSKKMCHLTFDDVKVNNKATNYKEITILPNTQFIGFDMFGIKRAIGLDASDATFNEYCRYIDNTKLSSLILTMHSWNFIKKWFFLPGKLSGDTGMVRKYFRFIKYARERGFEFGDLNNYVLIDDNDEFINLCDGFRGKVLSLFNNFIRFQKIARLNKKYFIVYCAFYCMLLLVIVVILFALQK